MVYHCRETLNINLPASHYDTNHVDRGTKSKDVMRMPVENEAKPLIKATTQVVRNHGSFNYPFFSTAWAILPFLRGDP